MGMACVETPSLMEEKSGLQNMILSILESNRTKIRKTFTVAIVGTIGVGKSSLINSIATAMSKDRWIEHAITGLHGGEAEPVTPYIRMYPQCCRAKEHNNVLIPTLLDIGGLPNELAHPWPEVLRLVFSGRVPDKENILDVYDTLKRGNGSERYGTVNRQMMVDRVLVVGSATAPLPETLLKAIVRAARQTRGTNSRDIPIFGVMTNYDLVDTEAKGEFLKREANFKSILGLEGAETRYLCCRNYCGATDPDNRRVKASIPELDVPILKLMVQICDPHIQVVTKESPSLTEFLVEVFEELMPSCAGDVRQFQSYRPEVQKMIVILFVAVLFVCLMALSRCLLFFQVKVREL